MGVNVGWCMAVWQKDEIPRPQTPDPKCSFIFWLVCKDRLRTRDRLKRWGVIEVSSCLLCGTAEESRDHLFFECCFVLNIWQEVLRRKQQNYRFSCWQQEIDTAVRNYSGNAMTATLGRLPTAVIIHCIWQERNARIFQHISRTEDAIVSGIQCYVVGRTWYWKVKRT